LFNFKVKFAMLNVLQVGGGVTGGSLAEPNRAPDAPEVKFGEDNDPTSDNKRRDDQA
jgi:hypothetical protein